MDVMMLIAGGVGTLGLVSVGLVVAVVSGIDRGREGFGERAVPDLRRMRP